MVRVLARVPSIRHQRDFRRIFAGGRRYHGRYMTAVVADAGAPGAVRLAFVTSRKVGNAVKRNRVRRRLRHAAWDLVETGSAPHDVVLIARRSAVNAKYGALHAEISTLLERAGVIEKSGMSGSLSG